jgi:hypothetical protein
MRGTLQLLPLLLTLSAMPLALQAQTDGTCVPVAQRGTRLFGCYITARQEMGALPRDTALFWHITSFPTLATAQAGAGGRGLAVESLGKAWLFTIAPGTWSAATGTAVAMIGPLPLVDASSFAAVYMEGVFQPGMSSVVHRHAGVEAWYTLEGAQCLESPEGKVIQRAGEPGVLIAAGHPMQLTGIGSGPRRSLVLILQDATQPRSTPASDWTPRGLCKT